MIVAASIKDGRISLESERLGGKLGEKKDWGIALRLDATNFRILT